MISKTILEVTFSQLWHTGIIKSEQVEETIIKMVKQERRIYTSTAPLCQQYYLQDPKY